MPTQDGVPSFYTSETFKPRTSAMINGAIVSAAIFLAAAIAIESGPVRPAARFPVDDHAVVYVGEGGGSGGGSAEVDGPLPLWIRFRRMLGFKKAATELPKSPPPFVQAAAPPPSPEQKAPAAAPPGDTVPSAVALIFETLDTNHDRWISPTERLTPFALAMRETLRAADANHDDVVTEDELKAELEKRMKAGRRYNRQDAKASPSRRVRRRAAGG